MVRRSWVAVITFDEYPWKIQIYGPYWRESSAIKKANDLEKTHHVYKSIGYFKLRKD